MNQKHFTNRGVAKILRSVAAVLTLKKHTNLFQIRAYENAADSIERLDSEVKDIWQEGKLDSIPGIGKNLQVHLNELFKTGKVSHFDSITHKFPKIFFDLLDVSGVGPKTALEITNLGVKDFEDLASKIKSGELQKKGFSAKIAEKILMGLKEKPAKGRMLLTYASFQAQKILDYLKKGPVEDAEPLGSLRRRVATIGDLDFAASSKTPEKVVGYFTQMPGVQRVVSKGPSKATVVLNSGLQVDLLVGDPDSYGALLQHFTGSKNHNIALRSLAEKKGYSLSEYGIRKVKSQKSKVKSGEVLLCKTEEELYRYLGMQTPPPELRENTGEIEAALSDKLPELIGLEDIKGEFHTHSSYPVDKPSHAPGADSIEVMAGKAKSLGYAFIGISDHSPSFLQLTKSQIIKSIEKRTKFIQQVNKKTKSIRVLNGLEVDILPDGRLSVPDEVLATLDYCIAGVHSAHNMPKDRMTKRLLAALGNPYLKILSHPTGRLLNERESSVADWEEIFKFAAANKKLLEINGFANRLDLRDDLVREALKFGVKFVVDTDAHAKDQMDNMPFGVSVARRGWATKKDVVNTWDWKNLTKWFNIN